MIKLPLTVWLTALTLTVNVSGRFRQNLEIRTRARKMFLMADNDSAIRRALLRKSCPPGDTYVIGQLVMYWKKRNAPGRRDVGRWHGPARIVCQDGSTTVWIAHGDKLLRSAPENLRPASLREWGSAQVSLDQQVQALRPSSNGIHPDESLGISNNNMPDEEQYSPGSFAPESAIPVSHQTSLQPESELFPEPSTNPVNTPIIGPHHNGPDNFPNTTDNSELPNNQPIDLDASEDQTIDLDPPSNILTCHEVFSLEAEEPIHEWNVFHVGTSQNQVCLADDGMPYVENPPEPSEHQCFMIEVPMSKQDILKWASSEHPEELAQVASASKRARAEVQIKDLSPSERKLFDAAKESELTCWL